jgi:hypothetical protein
MALQRQSQPPRRSSHAGKVAGLPRIDAPKGGQGKPCGASHIPREHKCSKPLSKAAIATAAVLGTAAIATGIAIGANARIKGRVPQPPVQPRLAALTVTRDERFKFAPEQFQKDLAKLSEPTKSRLLANHNQTAVEILSVNPAKDYVIAKFESSQGRWVNEHIGISSIAGRTIETRVEQESRDSDRWLVQFTIDGSLTRRTVGQSSLPRESVAATRLKQKRVTSMMLDHVKHLPPNAVLVASPVESDGGGRGRTAIYRRYGFKPDPNSAMAEFESEVSLSEFIKRASTRADAWPATNSAASAPGKTEPTPRGT